MFDPSKGAEQFESVVKTDIDTTLDDYHAGGSDYPALTDEAMDEMGRDMDAADQKFRRVSSYSDWDEDGNTVHTVEVSGYGDFKTDDGDIVDTAKRVADAGEWGELEQWEEDPVVKLRYVNRYLNKPNALDYISDAKLDNADAQVGLNDENDFMSTKRFRIRMDNALLDVAEKTLRSEADAKAASDLLGNRTDTPPF